MGAEATAADYSLSNAEDKLFTDPGYVEAWQKVLDLKNAGCWQDAPNATSPEASRSMFSSGQSPMIYCGTWCAGIFDAEGFTDYAMFRMPPVTGGKGDPNANFLVPEGFMVSAKTKHPQEAVDWAELPRLRRHGGEVRRDISKPSRRTRRRSTRSRAPSSTSGSSRTSRSFSSGINVLDVLLENSVSEAYLNEGVEILNGTKTPEQAMADIHAVALEAKKKLGK